MMQSRRLFSPVTRFFTAAVVGMLLAVPIVAARGPIYPTKHLQGMEDALENTVPAAWIVEHDENEVEDEDFGVKAPAMTVADVAKALLYTANLNGNIQKNVRSAEPSHEKAPSIEKLRGGGRNGVYKIPLTKKKPVLIKNDATTSFHGAVRGARGGDLESFLYQAVDLIAGDDETVDLELEMTLAMIYLDRACSIHTARSSTSEPCPFSTPDTVHRLLLTSLLLSASALRTPDEKSLLKKVEKVFGVSTRDISDMMDWMRSAQGESGTFVTPKEMRDFRRMWEAQFSPTKVA